MPLLSADEIQIVFLEMQPQIVSSSNTLCEPALRRAAGAVKSIADALGIPILASTVPLGNNKSPALIHELGPIDPQVRSSIGIFEDKQVRDQLTANRRRVLAVGGMSAEIAILHAVLGARRANYDVYVLTDCCGGLSARTEATAFRQMEAAGAAVSNVFSFFTSLIDDLISDEGQIVMNAIASLWSRDPGDEREPIIKAQIEILLEGMRRAWRSGDSAGFAAFFTPEARFVAFDGTTLTGPEAIAAFHARPFETYLAGSELIFDELTSRPLGENLWLVASKGGIVKDGSSQADLTGVSAQTFLTKMTDGALRIEAFHNTRVRPIDSPHAAEIWREFDRAWFADERQRSQR